MLQDPFFSFFFFFVVVLFFLRYRGLFFVLENSLLIKMACIREVKRHLRYPKPFLSEAGQAGGPGSAGTGPVVPEGCVCRVPWLYDLLSALLQPGPSPRASSGLQAQPQVGCSERPLRSRSWSQSQHGHRIGLDLALPKPQGGARTTLKTTWLGIIMDQSVKNQPGYLFHQSFKNKTVIFSDL